METSDLTDPDPTAAGLSSCLKCCLAARESTLPSCEDVFVKRCNQSDKLGFFVGSLYGVYMIYVYVLQNHLPFVSIFNLFVAVEHLHLE